MKKFIVPSVCLCVIFGAYIFLQKREVLPHDFGSVLVSWQRDRADNINDIIWLWRDTPLGKWERNIEIKARYGDVSVLWNLKGWTISDVAKSLSRWSPELDLTITPAVPTIPIPGELQIHWPIVIGNTEAFFYTTLGKMTATVPSKTDVQNQFQQILDIGVNKTFQLGENLPPWYSIQNLSLFTEELRRKPLFLMAKDTGEKDWFYTYTMTLASDPSVVLTNFGSILQHCDLSVKKTDSSDFLLDCHSDTKRIVWSSDKHKIIPNPNYQRTYEIYHKYSAGKKTWYVDMKENEKIVKNVEFYWTRKDKKVFWEIIGDDVSRRLHLALSGEESRESDPTVSVGIPTSIASWKEILQQMVR